MQTSLVAAIVLCFSPVLTQEGPPKERGPGEKAMQEASGISKHVLENKADGVAFIGEERDAPRRGGALKILDNGVDGTSQLVLKVVKDGKAVAVSEPIGSRNPFEMQLGRSKRSGNPEVCVTAYAYGEAIVTRYEWDGKKLKKL